MATHPLHDEIDLLDGSWYATLPHDTYSWMRENAPAYYDAKTDTWALTRYHDVVRVERDPKTFSSMRAPLPPNLPTGKCRRSNLGTELSRFVLSPRP